MENKTSLSKIILLIFAILFTASFIFVAGFFFGQKSSLSQSEKVINDQAAASRLIPTPVSSPFSSPLSAFSPPTPSPISDETKDWKTYRNEKYGYEVKSPPHLTIKEWIEEIKSGEQSKEANKELSSSVHLGANKTMFDYRIYIAVKSNTLEEEKIVARISIPELKETKIIVSGKRGVLWEGSGYGEGIAEFRIIKEIVIPHNNLLYIIGLTEVQDGKSQVETFDQILSTFKLLD